MSRKPTGHCVCTYDEYDWPSMEPDCPVHHQRKTLSEWWYTFLGLFQRQ